MIFVDEGKWFLQVDNPCRHLQKDYRCGIYEERPLICREYGVEDNEICCDHTSGNARHDREYRSARELERYIRKRFPRSKRPSMRRRAS
jgi:Fe-S-cluster containining protein